MSSIEILSTYKNYQVNFSTKLKSLDSQKCIYIVDSAVATNPLILQLDLSRVIFVDGSEKTKTIEYCSKLIEELAMRGVNRGSSLVAIGGGSVQDAATLTASLYMRGITWYYVPTTLMAMTDSCVGGKSAINVGNFKNLAGNFYPPNEIRIEEDFLSSLPKSAISSGLSEAVKIQIAKGPLEFLKFRTAYDKYNLSSEPSTLIEIVRMSLASKKWFIEIDEFDKKERQLLNYGHSFGHALESASDMTLPHGLAVGVGILVANSLVPQNDYVNDINEVVWKILIKSEYKFESLKVNLKKFKEALKKDKKNSQSQQVLVLLNSHNLLQTAVFDLSENRLEEQSNLLAKVLDELGTIS